MSDGVVHQLRNAAGQIAVERDAAGHPCVTPESTAQVAAVCQLASEAGWRVRIEGRGTWNPPDTPADLALSTVQLDEVLHVAASDLVATVQTGISLDALQRALTPHGAWLPLDPPGRPDRSLGSVVATGTAGSLRHGLGSVRDHILGCTVVTGDGRIVHSGGAVVKNVAGYDLTKLQVGGFGAFGVVTELHLRLRARPAADRTLVRRGPRDALSRAARDLMAERLDAVALELLSPAVAADAEWTLAVRFQGTGPGVAEETLRVRSIGGEGWSELSAERVPAFWHGAARAHLSGEVSLRLGVLPDGLDETLDTLAERLDLGLVAAGAGEGSLRWSGQVDAESLRGLRAALAAREIPLTIERAPWGVCAAVGHVGAYREGVGPLVDQVRDVFDPRRTLSVALDAADG